MAKTPSKDILSRLADVGEEALQRVPDLPGGSKLLETVNATRDRLDEMSKKVRGIDALEKRVASLEKQLAAAQGKGAKKTAEVAKATSRTAKPKKPRSTATKKPTG